MEILIDTDQASYKVDGVTIAEAFYKEEDCAENGFFGFAGTDNK